MKIISKLVFICENVKKVSATMQLLADDRDAEFFPLVEWGNFS